MKRIIAKLARNVRELLQFKTAFERLEVVVTTPNGSGGTGFLERRGSRVVLVIKLNS